jgi:hypothetical protein
MKSESKLHQQLDLFAAEGGQWLMRSRLRDCVKSQVPHALLLLMVIPAFSLVLGVFGLWNPHWARVVCLTLLLPLGWIVLQVIAVWRHHPTRQESLAIVDERFDLKDRLQTGDEFLRAAAPGTFEQAALEDSASAAERVEGKQLFWEWGAWSLGARPIWCPLLSLTLLIFALLLPKNRPAQAIELPVSGDAQEVVARVIQKPKEKQQKPAQGERKKGLKKPNTPKTESRKPQGNPDAKPSQQTSEKALSDEEVKETEGLTEGGQHSDAKSSGRSDRSMGAPGNQSPASRPSKKQPAKKKPNKKSAKKEGPKKQKKKVEDKSGATAGRGSSSGSSRNPASSDWSSKDRVEESEDQDLEEEDDVDDDESESEARGGLQPNLRDRRPPVNRDLSIGFGNRANPDANGRGGPSQRKKSRGVASLVLGVPVPDHVKGQPNAGRVKITQERIQPKSEKADPVDAEDRGERRNPYGPVPQRQLTPDLKQVVRDYFLNLRELDEDSQPTSQP